MPSFWPKISVSFVFGKTFKKTFKKVLTFANSSVKIMNVHKENVSTFKSTLKSKQ